MEKKFHELPIKTFTGNFINNCFYVENFDSPISVIKISEIFNYIKEKALKDEGLTVENLDERIIFIKGKKND